MIGKIVRATGIAAAMSLSFGAHAELTASFQFSGTGDWSLDGCGSNSTPTCTLEAMVPTGSTIEVAFLYSTLSQTTTVPTVNFDGTTYSGADWTALGLTGPFNLQAFRTDVTAQVAAAVGGGSNMPFFFDILSEDPTGNVDGEALAIIYSNPGETFRSIAFLDGFSESTGDQSFISLAEPLTQAQLDDAGFEATLSLGIGFGFQGNGNTQSSIVDINGMNLTTCAGGEDDGVAANGGLITIGGIGDDRANNHNCGAANGDDELYSLESFLSAGDSLVTIDTQNPSNDDNIFFAGLSITAEAIISDDPDPDPDPNPVPSPAPLALVALGLIALNRTRR